MGLLSSTRGRFRPWDRRLQVAAIPDDAQYAPETIGDGGPDQNGNPIMPLLAQLIRQQAEARAAVPFGHGVAAMQASGEKQPTRTAAPSRHDAPPTRQNAPSGFYSRQEELQKAAKARKDENIPVTPGLGPSISVVGRDGARLKAMSQAEFADYERRYQALEQFGDRWAEAGPVGGAPLDDEAEQHAAHAWDQYYKQIAAGKSPDEAAAWAATSDSESEGNFREKQYRGGPGRGIYQWGTPDPKTDRRKKFEEQMGVPLENSTEGQQFQFRDWEMKNTHTGAQEAIDNAEGPGAKAAAITNRYEIPSRKERPETVRKRVAVAEAIARRARIVARGGPGKR